MTIEFHCPQCQRVLRTADDRVGVQARCPGCGEILTVPAVSDEVAFVSDDPLAHEPFTPASGGVDPRRPDGAAPQAAKPCPVCARDIPADSRSCAHCGELLVADDRFPDPARRIITSDVLERGWRIFKAKVGVLVAATLVVFILQAATFFIVPAAVLAAEAIFDERIQIDSEIVMGVIFVAPIMAVVIWFATASWLHGGYCTLLLNVARGRPASFGQVFSGGPCPKRLMWANLVFVWVVIVGLLGIIPGTIALLCYWPHSFVLIDENCSVMQAFQRSAELTRGNRLAGFVLLLALAGIFFVSGIISGAAAYVLWPVSGAYVWLCLAVAYVIMTGRTTADRPPQS